MKISLKISQFSGAHFYTDTKALSDEYLRLTHVKLKVLPIPHTFKSSYQSLNRDQRTRIWWPGAPRKEKGLEFVRKLASANDPSKYELVVSEEADIPNTTSIPKYLSESEYQEFMSNADIILLPYCAKTYRSRSSGIFVEAVVAGKVPLVSQGTWAANELSENGLSSLIITKDFLLSDVSNLLSEKALKKLSLLKEKYQFFHTPHSFVYSLLDE